MVWLPDDDNSEDMLTRFDRMYKCDRQTDTQTHTAGRTCIESHSKNWTLTINTTSQHLLVRLGRNYRFGRKNLINFSTHCDKKL